MTTVTHVPQSNAPFVPQVPSAPVEQQGFQVPPAGPAVALPNTGSGNPIALPGQQPGFVQHQIQGQVPQVPQAPAQQAPQDLSNVLAILQNALGNQAPAAPVAPAQVERPAWLPESANTFNVQSIEDPIIRSMATILQTTGKDLDLDRVLGRALKDGDVSLIDYAYISEKGGANAQQLAEISKGIVQAVSAKADAVTKEVHALVGGEANWIQSTAVFNQSAPHELKVTVAQMLDSTNEQFIKAGAKIVAEYGRNSGLLPQVGAGLLQNNATVTQQGQGLDKRTFQAELQKLRPDTQGYTEAREALFARRSLGKASGL